MKFFMILLNLIRLNNNNLIIDTNYAYYQVLHIDYEIPSSTILSVTDFKHEISDIGQGTDYQNIASINLCYPHNLDFSPYNKLHFGIPTIFNQKQHLSISNNINSSGNPILYVLDHVNKVIPFVFNNSWEAVIPASQSDSIICYLTTDSNINFINEINLVIHDSNFLQIQASIKKDGKGDKINKNDKITFVYYTSLY